jgi:tRNA pseudouridine38-40 synthase
MARVKLTLEYDGTEYVGWQVQKNGRSLHQAVEKGLLQLFGEKVKAWAAARTDAGVHALGQVVAFDAPRDLPMKAYWRGLTQLLPDDIAVVHAEQVDPAFDPRRWSRGKRYRYLVSNRKTRSPLRRRTHWEVFSKLGRHDFSSFRASDCQAKHANRELRRLDIIEDGDAVIRFEVEGTAFLKHMVRNIVGTLVDVGRGKRAADQMKRLLEAKDRTQAGVTAPPQGLTLVEVLYGGAAAHEEDDEQEE